MRLEATSGIQGAGSSAFGLTRVSVKTEVSAVEVLHVEVSHTDGVDAASVIGFQLG
jgi:hypothetical protein